MKHLLLLNQKTLIKICMGLLILAVIALDFDMSITQANNRYLTTKSFNEIQVISGDSVWSIASRFVTNKDDIRELIIAIRQVNGLAINAEIYPGQLLKIPLKPKDPGIETTLAKTR